jgi:hypothetical protein
MKKTGLTRAEFIIVVIVTLVFTVLGAIGMSLYNNRDNHWVQIVHPTQDKAIEIVAISRLLQPYVRTESGSLYFCSGNGWQDTCTAIKPVDLPMLPIPGRWQTCKPVFPKLPALPGTPVNTLDVGQCQEGRTYARLVVLEDGTVWKWQRTFSWVNGFALASIVVASFFVGLLIGLVVIWVRRYLQSPIPEPPPAPKGPKPANPGTRVH